MVYLYFNLYNSDFLKFLNKNIYSDLSIKYILMHFEFKERNLFSRCFFHLLGRLKRDRGASQDTMLSDVPLLSEATWLPRRSKLKKNLRTIRKT